MQAGVFHGLRDLRIETVPEPEPAPDEVKLRVAANGLCGSDLHIFFTEAAARRRPTPFIMGHEFSGEVVAVGDRVDDLRPGDKVAVEPTIGCGTCPACRMGAINVCHALGFYGIGKRPGGLAEYATVRRANLHKLPPGLDLRTAALAEPLAVAHHAVARAGIEPGHTVAVFGAGPIGLCVYFCLRALGVTRIVVIERSALRRDAAARLGAEVLDPDATDVPARFRDRTDGRGADAAFETAGAPAAFTLALATTARQGRIMVVSLYEQPVTFDPFRVVMGEQTLMGSSCYRNNFPAVLDLLASGQVPTEWWVETIPLAETVAGGFDRLRRQGAIKLLVLPPGA